jgi:hypothetical protein
MWYVPAAILAGVGIGLVGLSIMKVDRPVEDPIQLSREREAAKGFRIVGVFLLILAALSTIGAIVL